MEKQKVMKQNTYHKWLRTKEETDKHTYCHEQTKLCTIKTRQPLTKMKTQNGVEQWHGDLSET